MCIAAICESRSSRLVLRKSRLPWHDDIDRMLGVSIGEVYVEGLPEVLRSNKMAEWIDRV